jgi:hypothetical protein
MATNKSPVWHSAQEPQQERTNKSSALNGVASGRIERNEMPRSAGEGIEFIRPPCLFTGFPK